MGVLGVSVWELSTDQRMGIVSDAAVVGGQEGGPVGRQCAGAAGNQGVIVSRRALGRGGRQGEARIEIFGGGGKSGPL